jgi:hypothetical protein
MEAVTGYLRDLFRSPQDAESMIGAGQTMTNRPACGRLPAVCARRPCSAMRSPGHD